MNRTACWLAVGLSLALPTGLRAQACLGVPQDRQHYLTATRLQPPGAIRYGGTLVSGLGGHSFAQMEVGLTSPDDQSWSSSNDWDAGLTLAHELQALRGTASVCPEVGMRYQFTTDPNVLVVPAGVAVGKTFGLVTLYVFPHFLWVRDTRLGSSNAYTAAQYGVTIALGKVVLGFSNRRLLERGARITNGMQVGFAF